VYLQLYEDGRSAADGIGGFFLHYNESRPHMSLSVLTPGNRTTYLTPSEAYRRGGVE
jgi:hypothetical protein